jgi:hypothetical protein
LSPELPPKQHKPGPNSKKARPLFALRKQAKSEIRISRRIHTSNTGYHVESFLPGHFEGSLSQPLQPKRYGHASNVLAKACLFYAKTSLLSSFYYWCYYWWAAHFWRHSLFCCWYIEHFHALKRALEDAISGEAEIGAFHSRYFPPGCVAEALASGTAPAMLRLRTEKPGERIMGSGGPSQTYVAR